METLELLSENITGEHFVQLINDCFAHSDLFSTTRYTLTRQRKKPKRDGFIYETVPFSEPQGGIMSTLDEFRIRTIESNHWFYIWTGQKLYVDLFQATEKARDTLLAIFDNIYLRPPYRGFEPQYGDSPGDICFFRNGVCWMGSCSHEGACYIKPWDQKFASSLLRYGDWRKDIDGNGEDWMRSTTEFLAEFQKSYSQSTPLT